MGRRRIYLLRHAEVAYFDAHGRPLPPDDVPLTARGRAQAEAAAAALRPVRFETLRPVEQVTARNLREYADLIRVRADSTLIRLRDDQFAAGIRWLDEAAVTFSPDEPVISTLDLLVLR